MFVPTAAERQGSVTIPGSNGQPDDVLQVPLNSVAQQILNKYPMPNQPTGIYWPNTYNVMFKQPTNVDQFSVRLDHHFSDKDSLFFRASYINNDQKETDAVAAVENPSFSSENFNKPRNYSINETHVFTTTLVNSFTFTLNRQIEGSLPPSQTYTQTTFSDGSLANWGPDTFITKYVETYFIPDDNVTWTNSRHLLNIGATFRRGWDNGFGVTGLGPNGVYTFSRGGPEGLTGHCRARLEASQSLATKGAGPGAAG